MVCHILYASTIYPLAKSTETPCIYIYIYIYIRGVPELIYTGTGTPEVPAIFTGSSAGTYRNFAQKNHL